MRNNKLVIEIRKVGFRNKGAELMLLSILTKLREKFPNAIYVMEPYHSTSPYEKRAELRLWQKPRLYRNGIQFGQLFGLIPSVLRNMLGIILDKEVDIVLDASGFSYSDQWGTSSTAELKNSVKRWKKRGTLIIMMPQAYGPFKNKNNIKNIKYALENANITYVRDLISLKHLKKAGIEEKTLRLSPDFTNTLTSSNVEHFKKYFHLKDRICIVPNLRMLDKTDEKHSNLYITQLREIINFLLTEGYKPFFLIHDDALDVKVCDAVHEGLDQKIEVCTADDPLELKMILGHCKIVIGSRYHALIGSLSQAVPTIALGWSHKYIDLYREYEVSNLVIDLEQKNGIDIIKNILNENNHQILRSQLEQKSITIKKLSNKMFVDIISAIEKHATELHK